MKLYLMQHGAAYSEAEDTARSLSPEGVEQVKSSGRGMKRLGLTFDLIVCSPKRRAQQTAALVAEAVRYPYSDILNSEMVEPKQDPGQIMTLLAKEADASKVLVVGHLPHLSRLADFLLQGCACRFENAGLAGLIQSEEGAFSLEFLLTRAQLASLGD